jgi:hypothetical protein
LVTLFWFDQFNDRWSLLTFSSCRQ